MSIIKRISAAAGVSRLGGSKAAATEGTVCPHCHRQTQLVPMGGKRVCQFCGKAPSE